VHIAIIDVPAFVSRWRVPLANLQPLLARSKSEVTFNFMFEFINRAASMSEPVTVAGLDDAAWRLALAACRGGAKRRTTTDT
jgi:hypothetical protein